MTKTSYTAIVAHDAGAAHHIIAWLEKGLLDKHHSRLCLSGPAKTAYLKIAPRFYNYSLNEVFEHAHILVSGTGWSSKIEHESRQLAHQKKIKSIAVLDHWVNYQERFVRDGEQQLADEIWVVDDYAKHIATNVFPSIPIIKKRNIYINKQKKEVLACKLEKNTRNTNVLFVMEPVRKKWGEQGIPGEIQALDYMIKNKNKLFTKGKKINIVIKPHPSDPKNKYQYWIKKHTDIDININENDTLSNLIAWSDIVIGCETYAMVIALECEKKVVSALPSCAPKCSLPHKDIIHLADII